MRGFESRALVLLYVTLSLKRSGTSALLLFAGEVLFFSSTGTVGRVHAFSLWGSR